MKREKLLETLEGIDGRFIAEAASFVPAPAASIASKRFRPWAAVAACLILVAVLTGAAACAAEAKEYQNAVAFFEENGLSTEGLEREDVKTVYRDILTRSFTNGKTAEVIRRSVMGVWLTEDEPTPEELANAWDKDKNQIKSSVSKLGFSYKHHDVYVHDEENDLDVFEKGVASCYRDGSLLWTAEFPEFGVIGCRHSAAGTCLWGWSGGPGKEETTGAWLALVDDGGKVVWKARPPHARLFVPAVVLEREDGAFAVFGSRCTENEYVMNVTVLDSRGNELYFRENKIGQTQVANAALLGDGFLVQLADPHGATVQICRLDREGNVVERCSYGSDDTAYHVTDMIKYEGKVYLSAYCVPGQEGGDQSEIKSILDELFPDGEGYKRMEKEDLVRRLREDYTAVLLICDREGSEPRQFYSVKGALGGQLSTEERFLTWDVENLVNAKVFRYDVFNKIRGTCRVIRYRFGPTGDFVEKEATGELTTFSR